MCLGKGIFLQKLDDFKALKLSHTFQIKRLKINLFSFVSEVLFDIRRHFSTCSLFVFNCKRMRLISIVMNKIIRKLGMYHKQEKEGLMIYTKHY